MTVVPQHKPKTAPARDEQTMLSSKRVREHTEKDLPEFRLAETAIKGPSSIWKLYYQGSVGGQALTGLPFTSVSRPRTIGKNSAPVMPRLAKKAFTESICSGCTPTTKRFGASGGALRRHASTRS